MVYLAIHTDQELGGRNLIDHGEHCSLGLLSCLFYTTQGRIAHSKKGPLIHQENASQSGPSPDGRGASVTVPSFQVCVGLRGDRQKTPRQFSLALR